MVLDRDGNGIISATMSDENLDPEVTKALDQRIDWINSVEAAERKHGVKALQKAIDELDDEQLRLTVFMLMSLRISDRKAIEQLAAKQARSKRN
jgi:ribosomal protein L20